MLFITDFTPQYSSSKFPSFYPPSQEKIRQKRITMKQEAITKEKAEQEKQFKYVPRINQKSKKVGGNPDRFMLPEL